MQCVLRTASHYHCGHVATVAIVAIAAAVLTAVSQYITRSVVRLTVHFVES